MEIKKVEKNVLTEKVAVEISSKLHKKIVKFFQKSLSTELSKSKAGMASQEQIMQIICYALSRQNADMINIFCISNKNASIALNMLEGIREVTQKVVFDFYKENKHLFQTQEIN